ncbi:nucleoside-diphosphate sugar epimerase/dehydratase [Desulfococcaceae bacterium HSG9]|nr:nucleoside-diphosphate sugar epimerase/dehydratase [Desulfococcaceae bacterium HSG9]
MFASICNLSLKGLLSTMNLDINIKNRNFWFMTAGDTLLIIMAYYVSYYLRFDGKITLKELETFKTTIIGIAPLKLAVLYFFGLYKGMWRYAGIHDLIELMNANVVSTGFIMAIIFITHRFIGFSRGVFIIDLMLCFLLLGGFRLIVRLFLGYRKAVSPNLFTTSKNTGGYKNILIIGVSNMGENLVREIRENPLMKYQVQGFVDDDPAFLKQEIHGSPVLGCIQDIRQIVKRFHIDEIIIAVSSASASEIRRIVDICEKTSLPYRTIPNIDELIEGRITLKDIREVRYDDLLGRKPVRLDSKRIGNYLNGKNIWVTGGAGSIGSELCRQIARFEPANLIIMDQNESALNSAELNLNAAFPHLKITPFLGSIVRQRQMKQGFDAFAPQVVFHAAAYKHVPVMERHPWEAVYNNVIGTRNLLEVCCQCGVERFVLVSTDKAVRPTNVMGASKRVAEQFTMAYNMQNGARYMAVRFGNVVGSSGSVAPLFQKQIAEGGPVTVTHPEINRYFMTIPEACGLILQAGSIGLGGEIFVLKMGIPVKIADMARDIIKLHGYTPGKEIEIKYTGLRPGEKLYEELITDEENIQNTIHNDIMVLNSDQHKSLSQMNSYLGKLMEFSLAGDTTGIKMYFKKIVPEYSPWFENAETKGC